VTCAAFLFNRFYPDYGAGNCGAGHVDLPSEGVLIVEMCCGQPLRQSQADLHYIWCEQSVEDFT